MMLFLRLFLFSFCLAAEVKVRATGDLRERPKDCLNSKNLCALQTTEGVFHFSHKDLEYHLGANSLIIRKDSQQIEFVTGALWIERYTGMKINTLFGEVLSKNGTFWVLGDSEKVWVRNVNANLSLKLRDGRKLEVPVGFQIWLGGFDEHGRITTGIPEAIPLEEHLRIWSSLFQGTKDEFREEVQNIKWTWGALPERASQLYSSIAEHQRAIADEREARYKRRKLAEEEENSRIRQLYIEKAFWR